jgi:hypothetical protein
MFYRNGSSGSSVLQGGDSPSLTGTFAGKSELIVLHICYQGNALMERIVGKQGSNPFVMFTSE